MGGRRETVFDFNKTPRAPQMGRSGKGWPFMSSTGFNPMLNRSSCRRKKASPVILLNTKL